VKQLINVLIVAVYVTASSMSLHNSIGRAASKHSSYNVYNT